MFSISKGSKIEDFILTENHFYIIVGGYKRLRNFLIDGSTKVSRAKTSMKEMAKERK